MTASLPPGICPECRTPLVSGRQACQVCAALALICARLGITRSRPAGRQGAPG